jgi:hypothetical protein
VQILTEELYKERRDRARPRGRDNMEKLEKAGLK